MKTHCKNGSTIESWWDAHSRNHITQVWGVDGNEVGDSEIVGTKEGRDLAHAERVAACGGASGLRWVEVKPDPATLIMALRETQPRHPIVMEVAS